MVKRHREAGVVIFAIILCALAARAAEATIILSSDNTTTLGGLTFDAQDLAEYNTGTEIATLYFDGTAFGGSENLDAVHVLTSGNIILSTSSGATLGGLSFTEGDLVEYNPSTEVATLFLDHNLFTNSDENIDAVYVRDNGNIILSVNAAATLGGLDFVAGDLAEYNPTTDEATLFFDDDLFSNLENIDAVHVLAGGNIILSTANMATLGGLTFGDGDLVEYNPLTDVATLYLSEDSFDSSANIDAVYVHSPEPATVVLLSVGSLALICRRRK